MTEQEFLKLNTTYFGVIYKITNKSNQKSYVGQAIDFSKRKAGHFKATKKSNNYLYRAIRKYGWENFTWEIIDFCISKEDMNVKETWWISFYMSLISQYGYNVCKGGNGGDVFNSLPKDRQQKAIKKQKETMNNKSKEEIKEIYKKAQETKINDKDKELKRREKISKAQANRSEEEWLLIHTKTMETKLANNSYIIGIEKQKETWSNKTQEELNEIIKKNTKLNEQ